MPPDARRLPAPFDAYGVRPCGEVVRWTRGASTRPGRPLATRCRSSRGVVTVGLSPGSQAERGVRPVPVPLLYAMRFDPAGYPGVPHVGQHFAQRGAGTYTALEVALTCARARSVLGLTVAEMAACYGLSAREVEAAERRGGAAAGRVLGRLGMARVAEVVAFEVTPAGAGRGRWASG